eukprot:SAG22_NODE_774_length_7293_cov_15.888796_3_plen_477_part_00
MASTAAPPRQFRLLVFSPELFHNEHPRKCEVAAGSQQELAMQIASYFKLSVSVYVQVWDDDFEEYALPHSFEDIPLKGRVKIGSKRAQTHHTRKNITEYTPTPAQLAQMAALNEEAEKPPAAAELSASHTATLAELQTQQVAAESQWETKLRAAEAATEEKLVRAVSEHEVAMAAAAEAHAEQLAAASASEAALAAEHEKQTASLLAQSEEKLAAATAAHDAAAAELSASHTATLAELQTQQVAAESQWETKLRAAEAATEEKLVRAVSEHEVAMAAAAEAHAEQLAAASASEAALAAEHEKQTASLLAQSEEKLAAATSAKLTSPLIITCCPGRIVKSVPTSASRSSVSTYVPAAPEITAETKALTSCPRYPPSAAAPTQEYCWFARLQLNFVSVPSIVASSSYPCVVALQAGTHVRILAVVHCAWYCSTPVAAPPPDAGAGAGGDPLGGKTTGPNGGDGAPDPPLAIAACCSAS